MTFLYARRRWDVLWDHPWRPGRPAGGWVGGVPVLCRSISKRLGQLVIKFHGWIDLTKVEFSAQES